MNRHLLNLLTWLALLLTVVALVCFSYSTPLFVAMLSAAGLLYVCGAVLTVSNLRRAARVSDGLCPRCGHDLAAAPDRCPECGEPAPR